MRPPRHQSYLLAVAFAQLALTTLPSLAQPVVTLTPAQHMTANAILLSLFTNDRGEGDNSAGAKVTVTQVESALAWGADVDVCDKYGNPALILAEEADNWDVVKCLVANGADVNAVDSQGNGPLFYAIANVDIMRLLAAHGVRAELGYDPRSNAMSAAAANGDSDAVAFLISLGANVNARDQEGWTPLMDACQAGSSACVRLLLAKGANPNSHASNGISPLMAAAQNGSVDCIKALLAKGANPNTRSRTGSTALMAATSNGNADAVKMLLAAGANVNALDSNGDTALVDAAKSPDIAAILDRAGARLPTSVERAAADEREKANADLLGLWIVERPDGTSPRNLTVTASDVLAALNRGADVNTQDNYGDTALMLACNTGKLDVVKLLVAKGADVNAKNDFGYTPLSAAAHSIDCVRYLISKGADVNPSTNPGWSPIAAATNAGNIGCVKLLVSKSVCNKC